MATPPTTIQQIPRDVMENIYGLCLDDDLTSMSRVCKMFKSEIHKRLTKKYVELIGKHKLRTDDTLESVKFVNAIFSNSKRTSFVLPGVLIRCRQHTTDELEDLMYGEHEDNLITKYLAYDARSTIRGWGPDHEHELTPPPANDPTYLAWEALLAPHTPHNHGPKWAYVDSPDDIADYVNNYAKKMRKYIENSYIFVPFALTKDEIHKYKTLDIEGKHFSNVIAMDYTRKHTNGNSGDDDDSGDSDDDDDSGDSDDDDMHGGAREPINLPHSEEHAKNTMKNTPGVGIMSIHKDNLGKYVVFDYNISVNPNYIKHILKMTLAKIKYVCFDVWYKNPKILQLTPEKFYYTIYAQVLEDFFKDARQSTSTRGGNGKKTTMYNGKNYKIKNGSRGGK
jgi:hypothetical protein